MRYLVQELGPEGFRSALDERTNFTLEPAGRELTTAYRGDHVGVHPQRQPGLVYVGCSVPVGRMHGLELVELARLAETYGDGAVRLGTDQNFVLTGVPEDAARRPAGRGACCRSTRPSPAPSSGAWWPAPARSSAASPWSRRRSAPSSGPGAWTRELSAGDGARVDRGDAGVIRMHFSGCSASCAQPQIADIGFRGDIAHVGEHIDEAVDIGLGGSLGPDAAFIDWVAGAVPVDRVPDALLRIATRYRRRTPRRRALPQLGPAQPPRRDPLHAGRHGRGGGAVKRYRLREEMNGIAEPPGKVWFWELEAGVIDADRCIQCGTCVAVCPSNSIGVDEDTTCPSWSRCAPAARCAGTSARAAASATRRCGRRRPSAGRGGRGAARPGPFRLLGHLLEDHRRPAGRRARGGRGQLRRPRVDACGRRAGRRRGQRAADRAAGGGRDRRRARVEAERRPRRAVEGRRHRRDDGRRDPGRRRELLQPDHGPRRARPVRLHAAGQAADRGGRDAVRDPGDPGDAGPSLADRRPPGRRGRADHRPDVHEELRLRGADPAGAA